MSARREQITRRMRELDATYTDNVRQLQAMLDEQVELGRQLVMDDILNEVFDCVGRLRQRIAIDTGRARAGWFISKKLSEDVPPEDAAGIAAFVAQKTREFAEAGDADAIYVINNVDYILPLDAGWSKTYPGGFISLFLVELATQLEAAARSS